MFTLFAVFCKHWFSGFQTRYTTQTPERTVLRICTKLERKLNIEQCEYMANSGLLRVSAGAHRRRTQAALTRV